MRVVKVIVSGVEWWGVRDVWYGEWDVEGWGGGVLMITCKLPKVEYFLQR